MISLNTNVVSETPRKSSSDAVLVWLIRYVLLATVSTAEIACGIQKIRPNERANRLDPGLQDWCRGFADRIFGLTEEAALAYGEIMGEAA